MVIDGWCLNSTGILLGDPLGKEDKTQNNTLSLPVCILMEYIRIYIR